MEGLLRMLRDVTLAERAGFEPVSKTGFALKRGAKSALEAAQIRLFATRFATIAKAGIDG